MGTLTGSAHGDAANDLVVFYQDEAKQLESSAQYFMAAVALALAMETVVLAFFLIAQREDGSEVEVPASVGMAEMIAAAIELDILSAPIGTAPVEGVAPSRHVAKEVIDGIRRFRNLIHPARALKEGFSPRTFTHEQYIELKDIYKSVCNSLVHNL